MFSWWQCAYYCHESKSRKMIDEEKEKKVPEHMMTDSEMKEERDSEKWEIEREAMVEDEVDNLLMNK